MKTHPPLRAAMNLRYVEGIEAVAPLLHLRFASFDRSAAPPEVKATEGHTLAWGVAVVLQQLKSWQQLPDLIGDSGELGKEPMVRILGEDPGRVVEKAMALKHALQAGGKL